MKMPDASSKAVRMLMACALAACIAGCGAQGTSQQETATTTQEEAAAPAAPADGTYAIEVETDSSMFRADSCELVVKDGAYQATLVLPGEGFSRLYFGSAEDAQKASDDEIYDYYLNDEGKYTFDVPVSALDEELPIAAFGHRRDTWYDHTITFHAPASDAVADAA